MMLLGDAVIPPIETTRWTASRKAGLIAAIQLGMITHETAYQRYSLSKEELQE
jgi:Protein of unknown function (DUF1153)